MTDKDAWEITRKLIEHEDSLINQRFTWLLVLNGFLFATFGSGVGLFEKLPVASDSFLLFLLWFGLLIPPLLGIVSGLTALNLLNAAYEQLDKVRAWWSSRVTEEVFPSIDSFPAKRYVFGIRPNSLVRLMVAAWLLLAVLLVAVGVHHLRSIAPKPAPSIKATAIPAVAR